MGARLYTQIDWYDTPLYYDIVFEEDTRKEGAFLEDMLSLYGNSRGSRILEPACGSGRLVEEMCRREYQVTGFDLNPRMLDFARGRLQEAGLKARLSVAPMQAFSYRDKFDLAFCLVSTFKYLLSEKDCVAHLQQVAHSLKRGGLYVLGLHLSEYGVDSCSRERWVGERDGVHVTSNLQIWPADRMRRREKVRSRLVVRESEQLKRFETHWSFRTYNAAQLLKLIRKVPELEHLATYDFTYEHDSKRILNDEQLDVVLVLRHRD